jgi:hypothetical protein
VPGRNPEKIKPALRPAGLGWKSFLGSKINCQDADNNEKRTDEQLPGKLFVEEDHTQDHSTQRKDITD